jgi:D-alanyl-D-alanine carboxypeptidase
MQKRDTTRHSYATLRALAVAGVVSAALLSSPTVAEAAKGAAIVVDSKTGKVLYASDADAQRFPASLTKMMTLYMLFEAIDQGKTSLGARIKISPKAAAQAPTKLGLKPGSTIAVKDAILALVTKSANDIAVAIAEHLGGSEQAFAAKMTAKARALGMSRTTFRNASGLPNPGQVTTARDMATLGRALQEHYPKHYAYFATRSFQFGRTRIGNHNKLLGRVAGVNGIKTGYTRASGFNLVTSVSRDKRQLVAVVLGGASGGARDQRMVQLIETYLPKASSGGRTVAMVPGGPKAGAVSEPVVLADAAPPTPQPKPRTIDTRKPATTASLVGANSIFAEPEEAEGDVDEEATASTAAPKKFAITVKPVRQSDADTAQNETIVALADPTPPRLANTGGWKIQLAATPTKDSAAKILKNAKAKAGDLLASAAPITQPVVKGDVTLYRARFTGFENKEAARAACAYLVKQDFSCLALSD